MCAICQLPITHEAERIIIVKYLDPGSGQAIQSFLPSLLAILSAILASMLFFFRKFLRFFFHKRLILALLLFTILGIIIFVFKQWQSKQSSNVNNRVIVLAFDGLDPKLLNGWLEKNLLPNFQKIKTERFYSELATTMPPQSPVAWASFTTGVNPAKHGIYDFITRNPENYQLDLTFSTNTKWKATPFWEILSKNNTPATILFLPNTYPPPTFEGKMLSGMGVPDILGTLGTLSLITTKDYSKKKSFRGKIIAIQNKDEVETTIQGPKYKALNETKTSTLPIIIKKDNKEKTLTIVLEGQSVTLREKEFSHWIKVTFSIDFFTKVHGIAKLYVKEVSPNIEVYVSPINFDPKNPLHPISYPNTYAKEIAKEYGLYSTLGLPHDTWALDQEIFDEDAFLTQAESIVKEREEIYLGELAKFEKGFFFAYFGMTDSISHMFFRFLKDPETKYQNTILNTYQKADEIVGKTLTLMKKDDVLIILSDHGFKSFDYEINLNTWLLQNGYLKLKDDKNEGEELLEDLDWSKTKAYAIGYNGIYFNLKGREKSGIVENKELKFLEKEITAKLLKLRNPFTDAFIIKKVYTRSELGITDSDNNAPDLSIGFYQGIRSSWDSAVGAITKDIILRRESKWSGDHLFDLSEVPGVLLVNKKIDYKNPRIMDIFPIVLGMFNISVSPLPANAP